MSGRSVSMRRLEIMCKRQTGFSTWATLVALCCIGSVVIWHKSPSHLTINDARNVSKFRPVRFIENVRVVDLTPDVYSFDAIVDPLSLFRSYRMIDQKINRHLWAYDGSSTALLGRLGFSEGRVKLWQVAYLVSHPG